MRRGVAAIWGIACLFVTLQGVAVSQDNITWNDICGADVVIMPEQL
jgi:hypothetical protein